MTDSTMPITLPPAVEQPDADRAAIRHVLLRYERGQLSAAEAAQVLQMLGLDPAAPEWVCRPLTPSGRSRAHKTAQRRQERARRVDPPGTAERGCTATGGPTDGASEATA